MLSRMQRSHQREPQTDRFSLETDTVFRSADRQVLLETDTVFRAADGQVLLETDTVFRAADRQVLPGDRHGV